MKMLLCLCLGLALAGCEVKYDEGKKPASGVLPIGDGGTGQTTIGKGLKMQIGTEPVYDPHLLNIAALLVLQKKLPIDTDEGLHITAAQGACDMKLIEEVRTWVKAQPESDLKGH